MSQSTGRRVAGPGVKTPKQCKLEQALARVTIRAAELLKRGLRTLRQFETAERERKRYTKRLRKLRKEERAASAAERRRWELAPPAASSRAANGAAGGGEA